MASATSSGVSSEAPESFADASVLAPLPALLAARFASFSAARAAFCAAFSSGVSAERSSRLVLHGLARDEVDLGRHRENPKPPGRRREADATISDGTKHAAPADYLVARAASSSHLMSGKTAEISGTGVGESPHSPRSSSLAVRVRSSRRVDARYGGGARRAGTTPPRASRWTRSSARGRALALAPPSSCGASRGFAPGVRPGPARGRRGRIRGVHARAPSRAESWTPPPRPATRGPRRSTDRGAAVPVDMEKWRAIQTWASVDSVAASRGRASAISRRRAGRRSRRHRPVPRRRRARTARAPTRSRSRTLSRSRRSRNRPFASLCARCSPRSRPTGPRCRSRRRRSRRRSRSVRRRGRTRRRGDASSRLGRDATRVGDAGRERENERGATRASEEREPAREGRLGGAPLGAPADESDVFVSRGVGARAASSTPSARRAGRRRRRRRARARDDETPRARRAARSIRWTRRWRAPATAAPRRIARRIEKRLRRNPPLPSTTRHHASTQAGHRARVILMTAPGVRSPARRAPSSRYDQR